MKPFFDEKQFQAPSAAYRGKPFWCWNCKLDKATVVEQLDYFREMGMGGATIHCRTGLDTPYLGEEFMGYVSDSVKKAEAENLEIRLYDEDRWPSGAAGGLVTVEQKYRARCLIFTPFSLESREVDESIAETNSFAKGRLGKDARLLARYEIILREGVLQGYRLLAEGETGENIWYAYLQISEGSPWYNNQSYANTLDKAAIERFLNITHEAYYKAVGDAFGKTIPSIFTDEPQFTHKTGLGRAEDKTDVVLPYTDDFEDTYSAAYGESFLAHLPEVVWELPENRVSTVRYHYHDHVAERFATAFSDTIGSWCRAHGIALTGHMMAEPTLCSQTQALGEAMRHYRGFDIPGIDMLCDCREYTTAKQAQSAAHQMGSSRVTSELYGVTNWDFDFRGHKLQGDWQAALGVTERVPHLSWMSMAGEAKRDYPASIFYQSPWYKKYKNVEDHFARVNVALQSGKPAVKIGVIHPVESYWLCYGPQEQTSRRRAELENRFTNVTNWLLFNLLDFDYISESLMTDLAGQETDSSGFASGKMRYDVIVVPGCLTLRGTTMQRLRQFAENGGKIIFMGEPAAYVDARPSAAPAELAGRCTKIPFEEIPLLEQLEEERAVDLRDSSGVRASHYVYQLRQLENRSQLLFIANAAPAQNVDLPEGKAYTLQVNGNCRVTKLDTLTGEKQALPVNWQAGKTSVFCMLYEEDSLLLLLEPAKTVPTLPEAKTVAWGNPKALCTASGYRQSEPNVLLLDKARYSLDGAPFAETEEVLRIDNLLRTRLGYPLKMDSFAQPWTNPGEPAEVHTLRLAYTIYSDGSFSGCRLALEDAAKAKLALNHEPVTAKPDGWFTDKAIETVALPPLTAGENLLEITLPYHTKSNLEWCYLLGDFGVEVYGTRTVLTEKPKTLGFCDLALQKFPFYAGNMTWLVEVEVADGEYALQISKYRAPLLSVAVDGKPAGDIQFAPYLLELGHLCGKHTLAITAYGSRVNAFGPVHLTDEQERWIGPGAWRTSGATYSYEYQLKKIGILGAPVLLQKQR